MAVIRRHTYPNRVTVQEAGERASDWSPDDNGVACQWSASKDRLCVRDPKARKDILITTNETTSLTNSQKVSENHAQWCRAAGQFKLKEGCAVIPFSRERRSPGVDFYHGLSAPLTVDEVLTRFLVPICAPTQFRRYIWTRRAHSGHTAWNGSQDGVGAPWGERVLYWKLWFGPHASVFISQTTNLLLLGSETGLGARE